MNNRHSWQECPPEAIKRPVAHFRVGDRVRTTQGRGTVTWHFPAPMSPHMATYSVRLRHRINAVVFMAYEVRSA